MGLEVGSKGNCRECGWQRIGEGGFVPGVMGWGNEVDCGLQDGAFGGWELLGGGLGMRWEQGVLTVMFGVGPSLLWGRVG